MQWESAARERNENARVQPGAEGVQFLIHKHNCSCSTNKERVRAKREYELQSGRERQQCQLLRLGDADTKPTVNQENRLHERGRSRRKSKRQCEGQRIRFSGKSFNINNSKMSVSCSRHIRHFLSFRLHFNTHRLTTNRHK